MHRLGTSAILLVAGACISLPRYAAADVPSCKDAFDPYLASDAQLSACGITKTPAQITVASDGSRTYTYDVSGVSVKAVVPPPTFDPTEATPAQLARYGIPPEPPAPANTAMQLWQQEVRFHVIEPSPYLITGPRATAHLPEMDHTPGRSTNWAGYSHFSQNQFWTSANGTFTQPTINTSTCPPSGTASVWVGLGGVVTTNLAQNGTDVIWPNEGINQAWWELYPAGDHTIPFYATPGRRFNAVTTDEASTGTVTFNWYNFGNQTAYPAVTVSWATPDEHTGEFIVERVDPGQLGNFGSVSWNSAYLNGTAQQNIGQAEPVEMTSDDGTRTLATDSGIQNSSGGFTTYWQGCK